MYNVPEWFFFILFFYILGFFQVQFVVPGVTPAVSSSIHNSGGGYPNWPNKTVHGNFGQNFRSCLHTSSGITEAWLPKKCHHLVFL